MSRWTHSLCADCYGEEEPGRQPVTVADDFRLWEDCCRCGKRHRSGIYYRKNPWKFRCNGKGGTHDGEG